MCNKKQLVSGFLGLILWGAASAALAAAPFGGSPYNVQWPQNSISMSQLQTLFSQNPGVNQFNIKFPNNSSWNINTGQLQTFYANYVKQAQAMYGAGANLPGVAFSSLPTSGLNTGTLMIPIQNAASGGMEYLSQKAANELREQEMNLSSWVPDWLKTAIAVTYNGLLSAYNFLHDELVSFL